MLTIIDRVGVTCFARTFSGTYQRQVTPSGRHELQQKETAARVAGLVPAGLAEPESEVRLPLMDVRPPPGYQVVTWAHPLFRSTP